MPRSQRALLDSPQEPRSCFLQKQKLRPKEAESYCSRSPCSLARGLGVPPDHTHVSSAVRLTGVQVWLTFQGHLVRLDFTSAAPPTRHPTPPAPPSRSPRSSARRWDCPGFPCAGCSSARICAQRRLLPPGGKGTPARPPRPASCAAARAQHRAVSASATRGRRGIRRQRTKDPESRTQCTAQQHLQIWTIYTLTHDLPRCPPRTNDRAPGPAPLPLSPTPTATPRGHGPLRPPAFIAAGVASRPIRGAARR